MKHFYLLLFFVLSFKTHSMDRLASLRSMPMQEDNDSQESNALPNPPPLAEDLLLKLWKNPHCRSHLELPLLEAKIKSLEKKHEKAKKAFSEKLEKVVDHAMYVAGYIGSIYVIKYMYEHHTDSRDFNPMQTFLHLITSPFYADLNFKDVAIALPSFLAIKNIAQAGANYYHLPTKPQEPQELLEARQEKAQLLLTLQQSEEAQ